MRIGAGHKHAPCFNRLPQGFQNIPREFWKFVHKEHAIMREADFTWQSSIFMSLKEMK